MDASREIRLAALREANRRHVRQRIWEQNALLQECLRALPACRIAEPAEAERVTALASKHCTGMKPSGKVPALEPEREYYIVWDNGDTPVICCGGADILKNFDDVSAVAFETVFLDTDFQSAFWYKRFAD